MPADCVLDADGAVIKLKDGGTEFGRLSRVSSDLVIKSAGNNNDILFKGVDASSTITALTLDMSEGGDAYFTSDISGSNIRASGDVIAYNSNQIIWNDYEFTIDSLPTFRYFSVKLVGTGTNSSQPPRMKNLRVLALA